MSPVPRRAPRTLGLLAAILVALAARGDLTAGPFSQAPAGAQPLAVDPGVSRGSGVAHEPRLEDAPALASFDTSKVNVRLAPVAGGFIDPVFVTNAGDGTGRLFVVEQAGRIRVVQGASILPTAFFDIRGKITRGGERGLLGLAFHPSFATHPFVYVDFTDFRGNTAINRYAVNSSHTAVVISSGVRLLTIVQPYPNHNGGMLAFGRDGYLYIGMGDGGSAGDPGNRAQSLNSLLGKILRIDVDHPTSATKPYRAPASNPYVGRAGLDEIFSSGLRNPWRFSFDMPTGQLWIGDVGQNRYEEIDRSSPTGTRPAGWALNYGWRVIEARTCYNPATACSTSGKTMPLVVYGHVVSGADNCAVTGGYVYRGTASPPLAGSYLYGDYCTGRIWIVPAAASSPATPTLLRDATASPAISISSFGMDERGEVYVCDLAGGTVYRVAVTLKP